MTKQQNISPESGSSLNPPRHSTSYSQFSYFAPRGFLRGVQQDPTYHEEFANSLWIQAQACPRAVRKPRFIRYLFADPQGTNGLTLPGNSLTSADIVINSEACFYLDPDVAVAGCNDFGFLLLHETGHVFGLDHSGRGGNGYFDSDFDPFNSMSIDCESPNNGLELSPFVNPVSVMNLNRWEPEQVRMELSMDELGALRFLYPVCSGADPTSG